MFPSIPDHTFHTATQWDEHAFQEAHRQSAVVSIRSNPRKPAVFPEFERTPVPWCENGFYLAQRPKFTLDPLFHGGCYYVQEASSMFVQYVIQHLLQRDEQAIKVLDLCAAPGGKSTLLASCLRPDDLLISNEVIPLRNAVLVENMNRWGYMNTWVSQNDPSVFGAMSACFDVMLIDAPCTGSGLWRKDPAAIDEWSADQVRFCSERQKRIIADVLPALKNEGLLLYATCSFSPEENEAILDWICRYFDVDSITVPLQDSWGITPTESPEYGATGYRFYPWKLRGEGFFMAAFRVKNSSAAPTVKIRKTSKNTPGLNTAWKDWLNTDCTVLEQEGNCIALHPEHVKDREWLAQFLKLKKYGTALGKILPKGHIPDQELAMSIYLSKAVSRIELDKTEALHYLKKEAIRENDPQKGWRAVTYEHTVLGWGKWLGNRMNNYLPKNLKIRMDVE